MRQPSDSKRQGKVAVHAFVVDLTLIDAPDHHGGDKAAATTGLATFVGVESVADAEENELGGSGQGDSDRKSVV